MNQKRLNTGFIGCGRIADLHATGHRGCPQARIFAVCDLDADLARRRQAEWGAERRHDRWEDLVADPDIDMVEILLPHHLHREVTVAACRAGKHVSVQKPMAMSLAECDEMIAAARYAGVTLRVFENFVFYPPYQKAKELIAEGAVGEPLAIRMKLGGAGRGGWKVPLRAWLWRLQEATCGGGPTIFDDGYHKFSVALYLLGPVEEVHGWIDRSYGAVDSPALVTWRHRSGALGSLDATLSPHMTMRSTTYAVDERVEITGSEGAIEVTRCTAALLPGPALRLHRGGRTTVFGDLRDDWESSFQEATSHFARCLMDGGRPRLTGREGRAVTEFALAALESARQGRPVAIPASSGGPERDGDPRARPDEPSACVETDAGGEQVGLPPAGPATNGSDR